jgi:hypothetical protein
MNKRPSSILNGIMCSPGLYNIGHIQVEVLIMHCCLERYGKGGDFNELDVRMRWMDETQGGKIVHVGPSIPSKRAATALATEHDPPPSLSIRPESRTVESQIECMSPQIDQTRACLYEKKKKKGKK